MYYRLLLSLIFFLAPVFGEEIPIKLEHASTPEELMKGLMGRDHLDENAGMTFNYQEPRFIRIWMYNCLIDLSVAFLDENKVIQSIHELKCYPNIHDPTFFELQSVETQKPAHYALEMNKDWFTKHGVAVGDRAEWDTHSSNGKIIKR